MNLAVRDIRYHWGRFLLTGVGLGLLIGVVMSMAGIYRGFVVEATAILNAAGADLWIVQKDTRGPFAESSRIPEDLYRSLAMIPGVREAAPVVYQNVQVQHTGRPFRLYVVGHRPGAPGGHGALVAGRPIEQKRYEAVADQSAGFRIGEMFRLGRNRFTVVGLTRQAVSSSGDPALFLSLVDAQELQFKKSGEAIRNDRGRIEASLRAVAQVAPAVARLVTATVEDLTENTHLANAVAIRLAPGADASAVARRIEAWKHYAVLTASEQEQLLTLIVIDKVRRQIGLFTTILLVVSTVIVALIIYTLTIDKTREIATLKLIGAPRSVVVKLIMQQSVALGVIAFTVAAILVNSLYERFPRRVVLFPSDELMLMAIVGIICILASLLGIRRALAVDPLQALGG
ncbi:MAG: ABC transporter permease [Candidatus Rokubacteria bacterium]|nr:ABC transporter permease [Candidatus Rokubacteria bacterium]